MISATMERGSFRIHNVSGAQKRGAWRKLRHQNLGGHVFTAFFMIKGGQINKRLFEKNL